MFLCYIDESGHSGSNLRDPNAPLLIIGGVLVHEDKWRDASAGVKTVIRRAGDFLSACAPGLIRTQPDVRRAWADAVFKRTRQRIRYARDAEDVVAEVDPFVSSARFELHATDLIGGHSIFLQTDARRRTKFVHDALDVLDAHDLPILVSVVNKPRLEAKHDRHDRVFGAPTDTPERVGMEAFVQAFEQTLRRERAKGIMICDRVENVGDHRSRLAKSQEDGAPLFGVQHVIETVHFLDSHGSPLLQLADIVTYMLAQEYRGTDRLTRERARVVARVKERVFVP